MSITIIVHDICKRRNWAERGVTQTDGERLAEMIEAAAKYARLHATSDTGQVPFRAWLPAINGHSISRLPVLDADTP